MESLKNWIIMVIKKFITQVLIVITRFLMFFISRVDKKGNLVLPLLFNGYERYSENFCNFKLYPKNADYFIPSNIKTVTKPGEFAIVLQGIIEIRDNFTIETVKLYKKIFPGAIIIISTWDYTDKDLLEEFKSLGCEIVLSKDFKPCGFGNVNYQICTSLAGIKRAKELGALYTLKNRSDLRIYKEFAFEYLKSLLTIFPVDKDNPFKLKGRIISPAGNSGQMFMPLWLQDFYYFGYTGDLINFFDIPYDSRQVHSAQKYLKEKYGKFDGEIMCDIPVPEIYITKTFIEKYMKADMKVINHWNLIRQYFIMVDHEALNSYWPKYKLYNLSSFYCEYDGKHNFIDPYKHISSADFLNLYNNQYEYEDWMEGIRKKNIY
jgi:WavE lipopolysaccharide synthesis